jgi:hypothetical protein
VTTGTGLPGAEGALVGSTVVLVEKPAEFVAVTVKVVRLETGPVKAALRPMTGNMVILVSEQVTEYTILSPVTTGQLIDPVVAVRRVAVG